jgi:hypothetical protein
MCVALERGVPGTFFTVRNPAPVLNCSQEPQTTAGRSTESELCKRLAEYLYVAGTFSLALTYMVGFA